jgi:HEAT repeat protein
VIARALLKCEGQGLLATILDLQSMDSRRADSVSVTLRRVALIDQEQDGDLLIQGLGHRRADVRAACVRVMGCLRVKGATKCLAGLLSDDSSEVRTAAAAVIGEIGGREFVEPLTRLQEDPVAEVRAAAGVALESIGRREARHNTIALKLKELKTIASNGAEASHLRLALVEELMALGADYNDILDLYIDACAVDAMDVDFGELAVLRGYFSDLDEKKVDLLCDAALDRCRRDSIRAQRQVSALKAQGDVVHLVRLLDLKDSLSDPWRETREAAVNALIGIGDERCVNTIISWEGNERPAFRREAAKVLEGLKADTSAMIHWHLVGLSSDESAIRRESVDALGCLGGERAVAALLDTLDDDNNDDELRAMAAAALGRTDGQQAISTLLGHLRDQSISVLSAVLMSLKELGTGREAVIVACVAALPSQGSAGRQIISEELASLQAAGALQDLVGDSDPDVRHKAQIGLRLIELGETKTGLEHAIRRELTQYAQSIESYDGPNRLSMEDFIGSVFDEVVHAIAGGANFRILFRKEIGHWVTTKEASTETVVPEEGHYVGGYESYDGSYGGHWVPDVTERIEIPAEREWVVEVSRRIEVLRLPREGTNSQREHSNQSAEIQVLVSRLRGPIHDVREAAVQSLCDLDWQPDTLMNAAYFYVLRCFQQQVTKYARRMPLDELPREDQRFVAWTKDLCMALGAAAVTPLITLLQDDYWMRDYGSFNSAGAFVLIPTHGSFAATILGKLRDRRAVPALIEALQRGGPLLVLNCCAAEALGRIGDESAVKPLSNVLVRSDEILRLIAVNALGSIGGLDAMKVLDAVCAKDPSPRVRLTATQVAQRQRRKQYGDHQI